MQKVAVIFIILSLITGATEMKKYNSFKSVWSEVSAKPLDTLPQEKISVGSLFTWSKNIILQDAKRTLEKREDILPYFNKLAHPNGICLKGTWKIHKDNPYSGYFKNHSEALIIARASSAMSNTKSGEIRAFGLAGKLFPTTTPTQENSEPTANFFVIDDLGGTDAKHFTDVAMTNEPSVTTTSEVLKNLLYALKVAKAFADADSHSGIRQLYEISELGEMDKTNIRTPKWIKITAQKGQTVEEKDFRDELKINGKALIFDIAVASQKEDWERIGTIVFNASVVSTACDHRLHFHHPRWREE